MGREGWSQRRGEGFVFGMRVGDGRGRRVGARSHSPYDHVIVHLLHHLDELLIRDEELGVEPAMVRARHRASPNPRARCLGGCRCHAEVLREKGRWVVRLNASTREGLSFGAGRVRRSSTTRRYGRCALAYFGVSLGSPRAVHAARSLCLDPEKDTKLSQSARTESTSR